MILLVPELETGPAYEDFLHQEIIRCAASQAEAVLASAAVGLVILECESEASLCLDLLKKIKHDFPAIPVIFVDGTGSEDIALQAYKSGTRDFFRIPLNYNEFCRAVTDIQLRRHEFQEENLPVESVGCGCRANDVPLGLPIPGRFRRVLEFMGKNYSALLSLDRLSSEACLSKYHFCRQFKKHFGSTPLQYLTALRINKAKSLLVESDLPVATIAARTGFSDLSEFNKKFKKSLGLTPSSYRKSRCSKHSKPASSG